MPGNVNSHTPSGGAAPALGAGGKPIHGVGAAPHAAPGSGAPSAAPVAAAAAAAAATSSFLSKIDKLADKVSSILDRPSAMFEGRGGAEAGSGSVSGGGGAGGRGGPSAGLPLFPPPLASSSSDSLHLASASHPGHPAPLASVQSHPNQALRAPGLPPVPSLQLPSGPGNAAGGAPACLPWLSDWRLRLALGSAEQFHDLALQLSLLTACSLSRCALGVAGLEEA